jgi:L-threonylcarbamoyladenylate synthase
VLEARADAPRWVTGGRATIAVRMTAHPLAAELCRAVRDAIVSTSANVARRPPHRRLLSLRRDLGSRIDYVLAGPLGAHAAPTTIRDGRSGRTLRS